MRPAKSLPDQLAEKTQRLPCQLPLVTCNMPPAFLIRHVISCILLLPFCTLYFPCHASPSEDQAMRKHKLRYMVVCFILAVIFLDNSTVLGNDAIWFTDLRKCTPDSALREISRKKRWRAIEYESTEVSGVLVSAGPDAPDLTLDLGLEGWHAVYVGLWCREKVRLKLTDEPCFQRLKWVKRPGRGDTLEDAFFQYANLSGQKLIVAADGRGPFGGPPATSSLAYVRCEPLTDEKVAEILREREWNDDYRKLIATNDGNCCTYIRTETHVREYIEGYRHSDVGTLYWGIHGELAGYPSQLGHDMRLFQSKGFTPAEIDLFRNGFNPYKIALDYAHSIGLQFFVYQRMGAFGSIPPFKSGEIFYDEELETRTFKTHPEWRCIDKEGRTMLCLSYAYPGFRKVAISILCEAAEFGVDGVNLQFKRGAPFVMYEPLLVNGFKNETGLDARELDEWDEQWLRYRSRSLTEFLRELREELNQVGNRLGKRLEISASSFPAEKENLFYGLDLETWIEEGLVDTLAPMGISHSSGEVELDYYARLIQGTKCNFYPFLRAGLDERGNRRPHTPANYRDSAAKAYQAGADGLTIWDEFSVHYKSPYFGLRRLGHINELKTGPLQTVPERRVIKLFSLGGHDLRYTHVPTDYKRIYKQMHDYWYNPL